MATKDSIIKQSIFFWVFGHRLSFEYGLKKFLFGAWRNLSGALRELILRLCCQLINTSIVTIYESNGYIHVCLTRNYTIYANKIYILFCSDRERSDL